MSQIISLPLSRVSVTSMPYHQADGLRDTVGRGFLPEFQPNDARQSATACSCCPVTFVPFRPMNTSISSAFWHIQCPNTRGGAALIMLLRTMGACKVVALLMLLGDSMADADDERTLPWFLMLLADGNGNPTQCLNRSCGPAAGQYSAEHTAMQTKRQGD